VEALHRAEPNPAGGGGRKPLAEADPEVQRLLESMLEETTAGDAMSLLKWTGKSTRALAAELTRQDIR